MRITKSKHSGFSLLEIIIASAIFCIFSAAAIIFMLSGLAVSRQGAEHEEALAIAEEGMEAARAIRDDSFDRLDNTAGAGFKWENDQWKFDGSSDATGIFTRTVKVETVKRDADGNIVDSGTDDPDMKKISVNVTWTSSGQQVSEELIEYLSRR